MQYFIYFAQRLCGVRSIYIPIIADEETEAQRSFKLLLNQFRRENHIN